mmetsp:Transcript_65674/g.181730  ORF Transcript_65674/g.181730 Transcript_65674/m.181730 type:complete len:208 (+) Transcript_65674:1299-1922(+)
MGGPGVDASLRSRGRHRHGRPRPRPFGHVHEHAAHHRLRRDADPERVRQEDRPRGLYLNGTADARLRRGGHRAHRRRVERPVVRRRDAPALAGFHRAGLHRLHDGGVLRGRHARRPSARGRAGARPQPKGRRRPRRRPRDRELGHVRGSARRNGARQAPDGRDQRADAVAPLCRGGMQVPPRAVLHGAVGPAQPRCTRLVWLSGTFV